MEDALNHTQDNRMDNISLEEGLFRIIQATEPINDMEEVDLLDGLGRICFEDVYATMNQPPFDRSPLDGYALKAIDSMGASEANPVELEVIDSVFAGDYKKISVDKGQAVRIMTGAPIPSDCDAVIRQEDTDYGEKKVKLYKSLNAHQNYCFSGEDYRAGEKIVGKSSILTADRIGIIASAGVSRLRVKRQLRVGLLTTGAELVMPGDNRPSGKIYNSGFFILACRLKEMGCQVIPFQSKGDDLAKTCRSIETDISRVDVLVTTGGVSVGQKDIIHPLIQKLGAKKLFWKLKLKPGSPVLVSLYKGKPIISLSGNPMAAGVTFELVFNPYYAHVMGCQALMHEKKEAVLVGTYDKKSPVRRFIKAYSAVGKVYVSRKQIASGNILSSKDANCLIDVPSGCNGLKDGDKVSIIQYRRP